MQFGKYAAIAALFGAFAAPASAAVMTSVAPSLSPPGTGMTTALGGMTVITFDSDAVGTQPTGFSPATGSVPGGGVVGSGGNGGLYAAPNGDTSQFYAVAYNPSGGPVVTATDTLTLGAAYNYFGLYWGSIDAYNTLSFYLGGNLVASYTGADFLPSNGNQTSPYTNEYVNFFFNGGDTYDKVVFTTSSLNFEIDNIAYGNVPEPISLALLGSGLVGLGLARRRRG